MFLPWIRIVFLCILHVTCTLPSPRLQPAVVDCARLQPPLRPLPTLHPLPTCPLHFHSTNSNHQPTIQLGPGHDSAPTSSMPNALPTPTILQFSRDPATSLLLHLQCQTHYQLLQSYNSAGTQPRQPLGHCCCHYLSNAKKTNFQQSFCPQFAIPTFNR